MKKTLLFSLLVAGMLTLTELRTKSDEYTKCTDAAKRAQKEMKIRFWENDEVIYHFKW